MKRLLLTKAERDRLHDEFKVQVADNAHVIDPDDEEDWHSLGVGWLLAKGFTPEEALRFVSILPT